MKLRAARAIFLAIAFAAGGVHADDSRRAAPASVRESLGDAAGKRFDEGSRLYRAGSFAAARDEFRAAHALSGDPRVLFNVAVCEKALGRYARAVTVLKESLVATGTRAAVPREYIERVEEAISTLARYVALVTLESPVEGAIIAIDGELVTTSPIALDPGAYTVTATKEGYEPATVTLSVAAGDAPRVLLPLAPSSGKMTIRCAVRDCEVRLGEESLGPAPVTVVRRPGSYVLRGFVAGRELGEQRIDLRSGNDLEVTIASRVVPKARLRVTTNRPEDTVTVDGRYSAASGSELEVPAGEHRIHIARSGGPSRSLDVLLRENETRDLRITLDDEKKGGISPWWFVGGGVLVAGAAVTTIFLATQPTRFEGEQPGTLNPFTVPAAFPGGGR